jgi:hypothetical protein
MTPSAVLAVWFGYNANQAWGGPIFFPEFEYFPQTCVPLEGGEETAVWIKKQD